MVVATREQVKRLVREDLQGDSLVDELVRDRREAAERDRQGTSSTPRRCWPSCTTSPAQMWWSARCSPADCAVRPPGRRWRRRSGRRGGDWPLARGLLLSYGIVVEPVAQGDAERAAQMWESGSALSLGDRLCLAQAAVREATV